VQQADHEVDHNYRAQMNWVNSEISRKRKQRRKGNYQRWERLSTRPAARIRFTCSGAAGTPAPAWQARARRDFRLSCIFVDYLRNGRGATAVAAYSTRARSGAPVSTPLAWEKLSTSIRPDHSTVDDGPG
jgi:DNA primase